jgi:6,7-dimethyl-8-ribityllumazine synthase
MATANLSDYDPSIVPDASDMHFGIVVSDWNSEITFSLLKGATATLEKHGADSKNMFREVLN